MNIKATKSLRAISFGEILTSRGLYVVLIVFAAAALGKFLFTGQTVNSTATLQGTLSQTEATKVKLNGAQVTALANLPIDTVPADFVGQTATTLSGTVTLGDNNIVVGVLGSNKTKAASPDLTAGTAYDNSNAVYGAIDRGAATRYLFSTKDLGQDLTGFEYQGTGSINTKSVFIYKSILPE